MSTQARRDLLRVVTAGSVDDGKSTLLGRLLLDTGSAFEDQLQHIEGVSTRRGDARTDLALLSDGLRAEREQGITIDVAYRYFSTSRRSFILADAPGHIQYTRNMVTGASTADLAIVLVDATKGINEQCCRHALIATLLGVRHLVFAINKMDRVDYSETVFRELEDELSDWSTRLHVSDIRFVPISALAGDNVVTPSDRMPWYAGSTLLYMLETVHIASDSNLIDVRFPVQWVIRPQSGEFADYRGYCGVVAGGVIRPGQEVVALPSGFTARISAVETADGPLNSATAPMAVTVRLDGEIDVSRGDMLCRPHNRPTVSQDLEAMVIWLDVDPLRARGRYAIKHTTRWVRSIVTELRYSMNVNTLERDDSVQELQMNQVGRVRLRTTAPIFFDAYTTNRATGSFILVDETTHRTVGAGLLLEPRS